MMIGVEYQFGTRARARRRRIDARAREGCRGRWHCVLGVSHVKRKQRERGSPSKKRKCPFLLDAALPSLDSFRGLGLSLDTSPSAGLPFGIKLIFLRSKLLAVHMLKPSRCCFSTHSPGKSDRGLCGHRGCRLPDCRPRLFPCHCRGLK